ncbi:chloride channel protein [Rhodobacteraceae bacterium F11138]|nr:chloride channel protein [Rhodobacteraceae bacterium F11138]
MSDSLRSILAQQLVQARMACRQGLQVLRRRGPSQIQFWFIALVIGIGAGFAALGFRLAISELQAALYGTDDVQLLHSHAQALPWYWILGIPIAGGLAVGLILHRFTDDGRVRAVADVIEGSAIGNGRVEKREGIASMFASLITLSSGGSSGREGPVVHMAAVISSWVSDRIHADGITGRDLLGCAVAAAVSASFNAPIAGALFALEVVLRHFAVHAFAPIVIASVAGTVINRMNFGDVAEFDLITPGALQFYVELPAFLLLGLLCGAIAAVFMLAVFWAEDMGMHIQNRFRIPRWLRPALAGAILGGMAIWYPHIIGVGYETTLLALQGNLLLHEAIVFTVMKTAAVAITFGGRMGGGVFSPSLMIGALSGLAFGIIATGVLPDVSGSYTLYAFAGMGAVAAAVLGAPISTTLIVFEMTGDWQTGIAVMVSVSMSTALASRLVDRSFFLTQLERQGIRLAAGPQAYLLSMIQVGGVMRTTEDDRAADPDRCAELIAQGTCVTPSATLETALAQLERSEDGFIPVVILDKDDGTPRPVGALFHIDALKAYNRALAETAAEEHS